MSEDVELYNGVKFVEHELIKANPEYPRMKLYSIKELAVFGIGENLLYEWYKNSILKPKITIGKQPRFLYENLIEAMDRVNNADKKFKKITIESANDYFKRIAKKHTA